MFLEFFYNPKFVFFPLWITQNISEKIEHLGTLSDFFYIPSDILAYFCRCLHIHAHQTLYISSKLPLESLIKSSLRTKDEKDSSYRIYSFSYFSTDPTRDTTLDGVLEIVSHRRKLGMNIWDFLCKAQIYRMRLEMFSEVCKRRNCIRAGRRMDICHNNF